MLTQNMLAFIVFCDGIRSDIPASSEGNSILLTIFKPNKVLLNSSRNKKYSITKLGRVRFKSKWPCTLFYFSTPLSRYYRTNVCKIGLVSTVCRQYTVDRALFPTVDKAKMHASLSTVTNKNNSEERLFVCVKS